MMAPPSAYPHARLPKKRMIVYTVVIFSLYALYSAILLPLSYYVGTDIAFKGTLLYEIIEFTYQLVELFAYCWTFAAIINARFCYGTNAALKTILIFVLAVLFRYTTNFLLSWKINGVFLNDFAYEVILIAIYLLLDAMQATIVFVGTHLSTKKFDTVFNIQKQAIAKTGTAIKGEKRLNLVVPYQKLCSFKNPLQVASVTAALLLLLIRMVGRLVFDITYGGPQSVSEAMLMALYYLSDIAIGILSYALIQFLLRHLDCKPTPSQEN